MGSRVDLGKPHDSNRRIFEDFQKKLNKAMVEVQSQAEVNLKIPMIYRRYKILMAPLLNDYEKFQKRLDAIDKDTDYMERAKRRVERRDQDPRRIAERLRKYDKMEVLQDLAFREGLLGREQDGPAEAPELGDEALDLAPAEADA